MTEFNFDTSYYFSSLDNLNKECTNYTDSEIKYKELRIKYENEIYNKALDDFVTMCKASDGLIYNWDKPYGVTFEGMEERAKLLNKQRSRRLTEFDLIWTDKEKQEAEKEAYNQALNDLLLMVIRKYDKNISFEELLSVINTLEKGK